MASAYEQLNNLAWYLDNNGREADFPLDAVWGVLNEFTRITDRHNLMEGDPETARLTNGACRTYALYAQKKIAELELIIKTGASK